MISPLLKEPIGYLRKWYQNIERVYSNMGNLFKVANNLAIISQYGSDDSKFKGIVNKYKSDWFQSFLRKFMLFIIGYPLATFATVYVILNIDSNMSLVRIVSACSVLSASFVMFFLIRREMKGNFVIFISDDNLKYLNDVLASKSKLKSFSKNGVVMDVDGNKVKLDKSKSEDGYFELNYFLNIRNDGRLFYILDNGGKENVTDCECI